MSFFKPGDIATVRYDLSKQYQYKMNGRSDSVNVVEEMLKYRGKAVKIYSNDYRYEIEEDGHMCWWTDEMFQEYLDSKMPEYVQPTERDLMSLLGV